MFFNEDINILYYKQNFIKVLIKFNLKKNYG